MQMEKPAAIRRPSDDRGQILAEYGLILAFVVVGSIVIVGVLALIIAGHIDSLTVAFP
jgi:uncharacterized membrane protein